MVDLHPYKNSPFHEVMLAVQVLSLTRARQETALTTYSTSLGASEQSLRSNWQVSPLDYGRIQKALHVLIIDLRAVVPHAQEAVQTIEYNIPAMVRELDLTSPRNRENAEIFLQVITLMLDSLYNWAERLQDFRSHAQLLKENEDVSMFGGACALLDAIDDSLAIYNRHWFCYNDLASSFRTALA